MAKRRVFKNPTQQSIYDTLRNNPPEDPAAQRGQGGISNAYFVGFTYPAMKSRWLRTSMAHAGWAAGVDNSKSSAREVAAQ